MFSTIAYCFAIRMGTLRQIEEMCNYDLRTMYLMDNERPSYKTFFEFINEVILANQYVIFTKICKTIIETFQLNITNQYFDGTKIEANAAFDEIYEFIHKVAKPKDIEKMKSRYRVRKHNNCTRKYGGKTCAKCFTKSGKKVIFHIRTYLYRCDGETVRKIATLLDCPSDIKYGLIPTLIDWILKQPKVKSVTLAVLKLFLIRSQCHSKMLLKLNKVLLK